MAEAGSLAEKVKQQADIVRVISEYVQLKKAGQNFRGLCPFPPRKLLRSTFIRRSRSTIALAADKAATSSSSSWKWKSARFRKRCASSPKSAASRFRAL